MEIPQSLCDRLKEEELRPLIRRLATRVEGRRAGVNMAKIVLALVQDMPQRGPESSALYQAVRKAVRQRVEKMSDMHFIQGLS